MPDAFRPDAFRPDARESTSCYARKAIVPNVYTLFLLSPFFLLPSLAIAFNLV
jgi:hypothetical protein